MPKFIEKTYKSIINKKHHIDHWFWTKYTINPYNGCLFGCIYCDARSAQYHMPEDFENEILVKKDVGKILDERLRKARSFLPDVVGIGGVTDSYQPAETIYRNTRQILEVLHKHRYPVHIFTKSDRVLEDLELLNSIGERTWCTVSITINTVDPAVSKFLDNRSPSPQKRLEVIKTIKAKAPHVQTGVLLIPFVPFLSDSQESFEQLFLAAKEAGADYVMFGGGMTLRDQQALWFLNQLSAQRPDLIPKYEELYQFKYDPKFYAGKYVPKGDYLLEKHKLLFALSDKYEMPFQIPRFIPKDYRKENYQMSEILFKEAFKQQHLAWPWEDKQRIAQHLQLLGEPLRLYHVWNMLGDIFGEKHVEIIKQIQAFLDGKK